MSELVERLRKGPVTYKSDNGEFVYAGPDALHRLAAKAIDELTQANAALMAERASLIETKRDQIERLTAERDAALAKVAQYEQAPVVGWKIEDWQQIYGIAGYRYLTSKQASVPREHWEGGEYDAFVSAMNAAIPLIARPEVTK